jgi:outer membrane biosynthesis protein TonB
LNTKNSLPKSIEQLFLFSTLQKKTSEYTSALNSLRLLTRILPFVFEQDEDNFGDNLFLKNSLPFIKYLKKENEKKEETTQVDSKEKAPEVETKESKTKPKEEEKTEEIKMETKQEETKEEVEKTEETKKEEVEKTEEIKKEEEEVKKEVETKPKDEIASVEEVLIEKPKVEEITTVETSESTTSTEQETKKLRNLITHIGNVQLDVPLGKVLVETLVKRKFKNNLTNSLF